MALAAAFLCLESDSLSDVISSKPKENKEMYSMITFSNHSYPYQTIIRTKKKKRHIYPKYHHPRCSWIGAKKSDPCFHLEELEHSLLLEILNRSISQLFNNRQLYFLVLDFQSHSLYLYWWETGPDLYYQAWIV